MPRRSDKARFVIGALCLSHVCVVVLLALWATVIPLVQGRTPILVTSGSMAPAIDAGDIVLTTRPRPDGPAVGEVIVYDDPTADHGLVSHRIVDRTPAGDYLTGGDANTSIDSTPVPPETIHGVARIVVPYIGRPVVWAGNGQWFSLALAAAALVAALWASRWALLTEFDPWRVRHPAPAPDRAPPAPARVSKLSTLRVWPLGPRPQPRRAAGPHVLLAVAVVAMIAAAIAGAGARAGFADTTDNSGNSWTIDTLDPPTGLTATDGLTITLDWTATVDTYAAGYRIYRSATAGGPYSQIADIPDRTTVSYVDTPPEGVYYYVARSYAGTWDSAPTGEAVGTVWRPFDCPADPDLRACIRFDVNLAGTYADESGNANTVTHTNGSQVAGISGQAAFGTPAARYEMADSPSLDLTDAMTIESWARFDSFPVSGRAGIIDNDGQYALIYYAGSGLQCSNSLNQTPHVALPVGGWFHAACTWDGAALTLYIDGMPMASVASSGTMNTANTAPIGLLNTSPVWNEPMDGAMDNLRVWHSARTQAQICTDAGLTGC